ncbi:hypothetical protein [uncultured Erythrobacter sp.]|uniref:hypothetical protein n=1 Tax=uncultured Erythrobacter sp. TaxID=263913 RepID=UPI002615F411|nr:hypothetical protein [uncultured Erythrobacter sp.]
MRALLAATLALTLAAPALATEPPEWRAVNAETGQISDVEGLEALAEAFPDSGSVRLRMLQPLLAAGETDKLLEVLAWLQARGYVFSEGAQAQIPQLVGEDYGEAARALLIQQAEVIEASMVVAETPPEAGLVESVFAPSDEETYIVTSITSNSIWVKLSDADEWFEVALPTANDLSGIVSEPSGEIGWVASANLDDSEDGQELFTGLIALTGNPDNSPRVSAPEGAALSDLVWVGDGTVYASDPINGGVYAKPNGATELATLVPPGTFRSPQGSAVSEDGARLYISDYRYGLAIIDIASGEVSRLASDVPVLLDGVDGLWRHGEELIAVQNGTSPMRISAFTLSEDGTRITYARILEQAHSEWTEPLGGSISGDALVYVGTGQWDRYSLGQLREGMEAIPTQIRRLPLGSEPD